MVYSVYSDELYHYGIEGQKWGVRRYQNDDGTLTEEGRKHYGYGVRSNRRLLKDTNAARKEIKREYARQKAELKKAGLSRADYKHKLSDLNLDKKTAMAKATDAYHMAIAQTITGAELVPTILSGAGAMTAAQAAHAYNWNKNVWESDNASTYRLMEIPITALTVLGGRQLGTGIGLNAARKKGEAKLMRAKNAYGD